MGEKIDKNSMALYGDRDSNLSFRNNSDRWTVSEEDNPEIVERSGFVPLRNRVFALMQSGERLLEARREAFRYASDEEPDDFDVDPTLQQDFTELDALQTMNEVKEKLKNARRNNQHFSNSVSDTSTDKNEMTKKVEKTENVIENAENK